MSVVSEGQSKIEPFFKNSNDLRTQTANRDLVKDSFEYRYNMFGYSAWLSLADGTKTNRQKVLSLP